MIALPGLFDFSGRNADIYSWLGKRFGNQAARSNYTVVRNIDTIKNRHPGTQPDISPQANPLLGNLVFHQDIRIIKFMVTGNNDTLRANAGIVANADSTTAIDK